MLTPAKKRSSSANELAAHLHVAHLIPQELKDAIGIDFCFAREIGRELQMRAVVNLQNRPATPLPAAYRGSGLAETTPVVIAGREEGSVPRPPIIRLMRGVRSGRPPVDGTSQSAPPEAKPDTGCPSLLNSRLAGSNPITRLSLFHPIHCIPGFEFPSRNGSAPIPGVRVHDGHHRSGSEGRDCPGFC